MIPFSIFVGVTDIGAGSGECIKSTMTGLDLGTSREVEERLRLLSAFVWAEAAVENIKEANSKMIAGMAIFNLKGV